MSLSSNVRVSSSQVRDAVGFAGAAMIALGTALIYLPAGLIVAGSLLLLGAVLHGRIAG